MGHGFYSFSVSRCFIWHWSRRAKITERNQVPYAQLNDLWTDNLAIASQKLIEKILQLEVFMMSPGREKWMSDNTRSWKRMTRKREIEMRNVISKWKIDIVSSEFRTFSESLIKSAFVYAPPKIFETLGLAAVKTQSSLLTFSNRVPLNHTDIFISLFDSVRGFHPKEFLDSRFFFW